MTTGTRGKKPATRKTTKERAAAPATPVALDAPATPAPAPRKGRSSGLSLVVVESPTKARTISSILGSPYQVVASKGHVADLPEHGLGYDETTFEPIYEVPQRRAKDLAALREAARQADRVIIATDPDREGEAIGWHVARLLNVTNPERLEFHEITPKAVREALANPRHIDSGLVDAQQARRVLDRMVGYKASPALWRTVKRGISAGRVQSVAMALVADREREIMAFDTREYWTVHLSMRRAEGTAFPADLRLLDGVELKLQDDKPHPLHNEELAAAALAHALSRAWRVEKTDRKTVRSRPSPPFTTSTLQQAASSALSFGPKRTMSAAQALYEQGLITYMRTDSVAIAADAVTAARDTLRAVWGADYVPGEPRHYTNKAGAQGAHECIRPTDPSRETVGADLAEDARRLYRLIRARFLACQATDATYDRRSADLADAACGCAARARSSRVIFPGWLAVAGIRSEDEDEDTQRPELPDLQVGEALQAPEGTIDRHDTQPPPRFTEASLVKALEERGVGRPSTYAPTVEAIVDRGYAIREGRALKATPLALTVTDWARERIPDLVDPSFTARVEEDLDRVAEGNEGWRQMLGRFADVFLPVAARAGEAGRMKVEGPPPEPTGERCPSCGETEGGELVKRNGRFGEFISCSRYPECKYKPPKPMPEIPEGTEAPPCPQCGGAMVARRAQRGRGRGGVFWGCANYPNCKGIVSTDGAAGAAPEPLVPPELVAVAPPCPDCGKPMAVRMARKGPNAGKPFFGCTGYPKCRAALTISEVPGKEPEAKPA